MTRDQEDNPPPPRSKQPEDGDVAGSYVSYVRSRRTELTSSVTGAMAKLGMRVMKKDERPSLPPAANLVKIESPADAIKRQRAQASYGIKKPVMNGLQKKLEADEVPMPPSVSAQSGTVESDAQGRVATVSYPGNQTRHFEFDDKGDLSVVVDKDGTKMQRTGSYSWSVVDPGGQLKREVHAAIEVGQDGTYSYVDQDAGTVTTETPDGTTLEESPDGYKIAQHADGSRLVTCPDGARMQVMTDGTIVTESEDGLLTRNPDGVLLDSDSERRITRIERADGSARELSYKSTGEFLEFKDRDGSIWHQIPGGIWLQFSAEGIETGLRFALSITVDHEHAALIFEDGLTQVRVTESPDGAVHVGVGGDPERKLDCSFGVAQDLLINFFSQTQRNIASAISADVAREGTAGGGEDARSDGSIITVDDSGQLLEFTSAAGRKFKVTGASRASYTVLAGDSIDEIACDAVRFQRWRQTGVSAEAAEVRSVKLRILRLNTQINPEQLSAGAVLTIPR